MRLLSAQVENFKSVEDSGKFAVDDVTCHVGKNEAGKTALLQALYKLNPVVKEDADFEDLEYPRNRLVEYEEHLKQDGAQPANVITTLWELEQEDCDAIREVFGPNALTSSTVKLTKGYENNRSWTIDIDEQEVVNYYLDNAGLFQEEYEELRVAKTIAALVAGLEEVEEPTPQQSKLLAQLKIDMPDGNPIQTAMRILTKVGLPTFLYFSNYQQMPGEVAIDELLKKKKANQLGFADLVFLALLDSAGTSPEDIQEITRFEPLIAKLEAISNRLSREIFGYWSQNRHLKVDFRFDAARPDDPPPLNTGYIFRTRIENTRHGVTVSFDERSAGFVWFFSFLIWFSQVRKSYGKKLLILLDEPGLSLHAKAQADLLRYINEKLKPEYQVIYTTHSPFMIDPENLMSIKTVEDLTVNEEILGTKVNDKIFSTDVDTLFPLQAALGYEITQTLFVGKNTLLVEGPCDLLYLTWFSQELKSRKRCYLDPRWVITPAGGIDKIGSFLALFGGNKLHVAVLTDFQEGEKKKVRSLKESDLLRRGHVLSAEMFTGQSEADIEDLLGRSLYVALVDSCYSLAKSHQLPAGKPSNAPIRVVKEVEQHFATLPPKYPDFNHYEPASYLIEKGSELRTKLPDLYLPPQAGRCEEVLTAHATLSEKTCGACSVSRLPAGKCNQPIVGFQSNSV